MFVRTAFVAAVAALAFPLLGGTASASCLDDAWTGLPSGYQESQKSQYWSSLGYVEQDGLITYTVRGDALVSDALLRTGDSVRWTEVVVGNAPDVTTEFVDCVAG